MLFLLTIIVGFIVAVAISPYLVKIRDGLVSYYKELTAPENK